MSSSIKSLSSSATDRILSLTNHFKDSLNPADDLHKTVMTDYKFQGWMGLNKDGFKQGCCGRENGLAGV